QFAMRHLDGDEPLQLVIVGEIDKPETALTDDFFDAVATDVLRLRSGKGINGGLVVAARLVITGSFRVVHGSSSSSRTSLAVLGSLPAMRGQKQARREAVG